MTIKKDIILDVIQLIIILSLFIATTLTKSFRFELLVFLLLYFGIVVASYMPSLWNIPVNMDNLSEETKKRIMRLMFNFVLLLKIDFFVIYVFACVSVLCALDLVFIIVLLLGLIIFGIYCIYVVHRIIKISRENEN